MNPLMIRFGLSPILTVPGRHSGQRRSVPIGGPFLYNGDRYLVSGRGSTHWARNLRAAGRGELRTHGVTETFYVVEVTGAEHEAVIGAYRRALGRSVARYFSSIPAQADHHVFRMESIEVTGAA
ncbi:MAG TPA: nitroreductase/quinone reductase family protein [Candidatus Limnocylindrales bacterium]